MVSPIQTNNNVVYISYFFLLLFTSQQKKTKLMFFLLFAPLFLPPFLEHTTNRPNSKTVLVTEAHISLLLHACCLTRHTGADGGAFSQSCYQFSLPGAGPALRGVAAGRKELMDALRRRKHPEMLEKDLFKRKLKGCPLGMGWLLRDVVGGGGVVRIETTVGSLIRVVR